MKSELLRETRAACWIEYRDKDWLTVEKHLLYGVKLKRKSGNQNSTTKKHEESKPVVKVCNHGLSVATAEVFFDSSSTSFLAVDLSS